MSTKALGLIETIGMAAAVEAADTAVKSANVRLIGYELTRGGGMVSIKIEGDVGAVKAAVEAAKASAAKVNDVYSVLVIPRPANGLEHLIRSAETVGITPPPKEETEKTEEEHAPELPAEKQEEPPSEEPPSEEPPSEEPPNEEPPKEEPPGEEPPSEEPPAELLTGGNEAPKTVKAPKPRKERSSGKKRPFNKKEADGKE